MFDLRYHVASLSAVFLALIIGILVGVGISDRGLVDSFKKGLLEQRVASLQKRLDQASKHADAANRERRAAQTYINDTYPVLVHNRLHGQHVAVVFVGSEDAGIGSTLERMLSDDFEFYSPADVGIGRERYFERCWPNSELIDGFRFERLFELDDEVFVTYESTKSDGSRFRNTEVLTFAGEKLRKAEVYFGWSI